MYGLICQAWICLSVEVILFAVSLLVSWLDLILLTIT